MEITLEASDLARAIGCVKGVAPARQTIPILSHVLLEAEDRTLSVTAFDTEMQARTSATVEVVTPGSITIPAHVLFGIAKALPKSKLVTIKIEGDRARVTCGKSKYDLRTLPAADFPTMAPLDPETETRFEMPVADMKAAMDLVKPTFNPDHPQLFYKGLWLLIEDGVLAFMAADGHRLSRILSHGQACPASMPPTLLPGNAVREIVSLLAGAEGSAHISITKQRIEVEAGGVSLSSRLIESSLPNYRPIIPDGHGPSFSVRAGELSDAIDRLLIVYSDTNTKTPTAVVSGKGSSVEITAGKDGSDYGTETIDAEVRQSILFSVSAPYLSELVKLWPSEAILTISADGTGPVLIASKDVPNQTQIVMQMHGPQRARQVEAIEDVAA